MYDRALCHDPVLVGGACAAVPCDGRGAGDVIDMEMNVEDGGKLLDKSQGYITFQFVRPSGTCRVNACLEGQSHSRALYVVL